MHRRLYGLPVCKSITKPLEAYFRPKQSGDKIKIVKYIYKLVFGSCFIVLVKSNHNRKLTTAQESLNRLENTPF